MSCSFSIRVTFLYLLIISCNVYANNQEAFHPSYDYSGYFDVDLFDSNADNEDEGKEQTDDSPSKSPSFPEPSMDEMPPISIEV